MPKLYPEEFKAKVLAVYAADGPHAAARQFGIPRSTVQRWAKAAGIETSSAAKSTTEAARAKLESMRAELRVETAETCLAMLRRLREPYEDVRMVNDKPVKVTLDRPLAKETRDLTWAAAVLFDKVRLEAGEPTERTESITTDQIDREIARLEHELAKEKPE